MNYIELINDFWTYCEYNEVSTSEKVTYFALLNYCNKLNWKNPFLADWSVLVQYSGISKNSHYTALESLDKKGIIQYVKGEKNKLKAQIFILKIKNKTENKTENNIENNIENNFENKTKNKTENKIENLIKQENNKTLKQENIKTLKQEKEIFSSKENSENLPNPKKQKIPSLDEFMNYYYAELFFNFPNLAFAVQAKYESWIDNGWKNGYNKPIKNWKTALKNTIQHLKPINHGNNSTNSAFRKPNADELYEQTRQRLRNASFDDSDPWDGTHGHTNTPQADSWEDVQHVEVD